MHPSTTASSTAPHDNIVLLTLSQYVYKATMEINGVFQKGYISRQANSIYHFSIQRGTHPPIVLWGVSLYKFEQHWDEMMMGETIFPGHNMV